MATIDNQKGLSPLLTVVATGGTIIASVIPIFTSSTNKFLAAIFINPNTIPFASTISSILLVMLIWICNSEIGRQVFVQLNPSALQLSGVGFRKFLKSKFRLADTSEQLIVPQSPEKKIDYLIRFMALLVVFYGAKILSSNHAHVIEYLELLQFVTYVSAFYCLGASLGLTIWYSLNTSRFTENYESRTEMIRDALIRQNIVNIDLKILMVSSKIFDTETGPYYLVEFTHDGQHYKGTVSSDFQVVNVSTKNPEDNLETS